MAREKMGACQLKEPRETHEVVGAGSAAGGGQRCGPMAQRWGDSGCRRPQSEAGRGCSGTAPDRSSACPQTSPPARGSMCALRTFLRQNQDAFERLHECLADSVGPGPHVSADAAFSSPENSLPASGRWGEARGRGFCCDLLSPQPGLSAALG